MIWSASQWPKLVPVVHLGGPLGDVGQARAFVLVAGMAGSPPRPAGAQTLRRLDAQGAAEDGRVDRLDADPLGVFVDQVRPGAIRPAELVDDPVPQRARCCEAPYAAAGLGGPSS